MTLSRIKFPKDTTKSQEILYNKIGSNTFNAQFITVRSVHASSDGSIAAIVGDQGGLLICNMMNRFMPRCDHKSWAKFGSVAFDNTGTNIIAAPDTGYNLKYGRVSDADSKWTSTANLAGPKGVAGSWSSCVASDSFSVLVCAQYGGYTYASRDSGVTWTASSSTYFFTSLAITSSGNSIIAGSSYSAPYVALSNDGLTWQEQKGCQASVPTNAVAITSTNYYSARSVSITKKWRYSDPKRQRYGYYFCYTAETTVNGKTTYSGYQGTQSLYKSSTAKFSAENNGESDNDANTITVASSSEDDDGSFTIDTSTEFVWSEYSNSKSASYESCAVSSDGTVIVGAIGEGGLEISVDSGDTWTTSTAAGKHVDWSDVSTSSDGSHIFAVTYNGSVYASNDYGVTLTKASVPVEDDFISVKCSR